MTPAPLAVFPVVGRGLNEFGRMLGWLVPLSALSLVVPNALDGAFRAARFRGSVADGIVFAAFVAVWALQLAAAQSRAAASDRGERRAFPVALWNAARRLPSAAIAAVLVTVAVAAGLAMLVAPGLAALAGFAAAPAIAVDEGCGSVPALGLSLEASRGSRLRILAVIAILGAVAALGLMAVFVALVATDVPSSVAPFAAIAAVVLLSALPAIGAALAHGRLLRVNGAPRPEELERVFG